jgi:hypothetical protein
MTQRSPRRYRTAAGTPRRQPRVRRASAGLTPIRSAAILAMLLSAGAFYGLLATSAFGFQRLAITGNVLTSEAAIRAAVGLQPGTNLVGVGTGPMVERLTAIASIAEADVGVALPDVLEVRLRERRPVIVWAIGDRRLAVDDGGLLFADVAGEAAQLVAGTPVVRDERAASTGLNVGARLDPTDLDAATRLGSLTPGQVGSHARALALRVTDERGFTVTSGSGSWQAVFGFYGRSQRTPALIPGQIQLLGALLAGREDTVQTVILADDREGTYLPKATPRPTPTPRPSRAP